MIDKSFAPEKASAGENPFYKQSVFIDKSAFIAFMNSGHPCHRKARSVFLELDDLERPLVTSSPVISEVHAWLRDNVGYDHAQFFLNAIDKAVQREVLHVLAMDREIEREAKALLFEYPDFALSLPEAIILVMMTKNGIERLFTFNRHFAALPLNETNIKVIPSVF
ncbi:hypothetical protein BSNK01_07250 [Bacillaceae bacterium]